MLYLSFLTHPIIYPPRRLGGGDVYILGKTDTHTPRLKSLDPAHSRDNAPPLTYVILVSMFAYSHWGGVRGGRKTD